MSINISYRPVSPQPATAVETSTPHRLRQCLEEAFGPFPIHLTGDSIDILVGMSIGGVSGCAQLITAIREFDTIEIF